MQRHPKERVPHQRSRDLADGGEKHRTVDHVIKTAEDSVRHAEFLGFVALHKPITQREAAHAAIPHGAEPINRRDEKPVHHTPHTAHAVGDGAAGGVHRVSRAGAGAEGGEGLEELAELAAAHEKVFLLFLFAHQPKADAGHTGKVNEEDEVIDEGHARLLRRNDSYFWAAPNKKAVRIPEGSTFENCSLLIAQKIPSRQCGRGVDVGIECPKFG